MCRADGFPLKPRTAAELLGRIFELLDREDLLAIGKPIVYGGVSRVRR